MKSVSGKNWEELKNNQRLIEKIKIDHNLSHIQAKILLSRSFTETEIFSIKNKIDFKNPFYKNKDFLSACALLKKNIEKKSSILIIGDYDVDGCISTALMVNFFKKINLNSHYFIPNRFKDGYGASQKLIKELISKKKPNLIIFLDCGSNSHDAIKYINLLKIDSFIIDHHNIQKPYPEAKVFINPKKKFDYNNIDYLCSGFLTYLFLDLYINLNKLKLSIKEYLIYALLATVADVMPIRGINMLLAKNVLRNFDINENFLFSSLFELLKIKKKIELDDLAFLIGPIFNSAGRLDDANEIVKLLTIVSKKKQIRILNYIYNLNKKRKLIEKRYLDDLDFSKISKQKGIIFIYKSNISEGLIGILASKLKEYFNKPCIVFTNSGTILKGSARSIVNFNISSYIHKAIKKKIIISGGGHNLAAGVSLYKSNIKTFKNYLDNFYINKDLNLINNFTSELSLNSINTEFIKNINILGPFGNGNTNPIFLFSNIKFVKPSILKNKFISCYIKSSNKVVRAISFNHLKSKISYEIINCKTNVNLLAKVKENNWNNKKTIQLEIIDIIKTSNKT